MKLEFELIDPKMFSFNTIEGCQNSINLLNKAKNNSLSPFGEVLMSFISGYSFDEYIKVLEDRIKELKKEESSKPGDDIDETYDEDDCMYPDGYDYIHKVSDEQYNIISKMAEEFISINETSKDIEISENQRKALKGTLMEFAAYIAMR